MNKGTLFIAPLGAKNKKEPVFKEIISQCPDNNYSSILYIGPNNFVLSTARSRFNSFLNKTFKTSAYIPFRTMTLKQLASDLHEKCGGKDVISDHIKTLILCEILKEKNIGYAQILSDLSNKISHYIPDKALSQVKDNIKHLIFEEKAAERAVGAMDILQLYKEELEVKNLLDPDDMLKNSIPLIKEHMSPAVLVIDGFYDPTPLELEIMSALIDRAQKVFVIAEERTEIIKFLQSNKKGFITKNPGIAEYREKTGYYSYPSIEEEVEGIAKNIKKLFLEGTKPWDITVCFPVLSKYLPMLRRILPKYGIPVSIGEYSLSATRPFIALEDMIACIEGDYSRSDFLSFLTSPHFPAIPVVVKERAVSYSYRAGVVKGINSWLSIKETLLNAPGDRVSDDKKVTLDEFQHGIKLVLDTFENIKQKKKPGPFIDAFESALARFGFFDSPGDAGSDMHGERILNKINSRLSEFRYFSGLYESGRHNVNPPVFYLKYLLSNLKGSEENRDGVKIIPFELAAGCETKVLFFGGILEGDFPSRPDIDPILPERVKKELGMPYLEYYLKRQKRYFMRLLNVSVRDPYFSCPSADGDKIFLPSPFLDWEQIMPPLELNIFSEEESMIREGAFKLSSKESGIFRDNEIFRGKKGTGPLLRRISAMSNGFFSVTDIDFYRKCPLRFYIEKVLGLEVIVPPQFEVEARLWGSLAHKTMEYLFKDGDIEIEDLDKKLSQGLEKSLKQFPIGDFWARVAKEIFQKLLPAIKEQENDIRMQGFIPFKVEEKLKVEIGRLKLKGKVDRIDIRSQKSEERRKKKENIPPLTKGGEGGFPGDTVILLDYKTGNIDRNSLQLALYAAMWQKNFSVPVEKVGYYSLKEGHVSWSPGKVSMDEFMQSALQSAEELISQIRKGVFSPEPFRADECRYCYHSPLCDRK